MGSAFLLMQSYGWQGAKAIIASILDSNAGRRCIETPFSPCAKYTPIPPLFKIELNSL